MPLPAFFDHQSVSIHPQTAGFTARYVWRGCNRDAIWRCCNMDAHQSTERVKHDEIYHLVTITRCRTCYRTTDLRTAA